MELGSLQDCDIKMGVFQGKAIKIDSDFVWTEIPDLGVDQQFPCRYTIKKPDIGDNVLVLNIEGALEDLVVVGSLQKEISVSGESGGDIDGGTIAGGGTSGDVDGGVI